MHGNVLNFKICSPVTPLVLRRVCAAAQIPFAKKCKNLMVKFYRLPAVAIGGAGENLFLN